MSDIRFFALGGLGENGKNMYVLDVNKKYFILDAGIKYPTAELHGVDEIVPDYRMLTRVKDHVRGIFLSHAHEDHISAVPHLIDDLNVPIYATNFTMQILKDTLKEKGFDLSKYQLNIIDENSILRFEQVKVSFFSTAHSIPESVGIAVHTTEGSIVYTSDFSFVQGKDRNYFTNFKKINEIADKKVLLLLTESLGSVLSQDSGINDVLNHKLNSIISNADGRVIVSLFSSDLQKIQRVIDIALMHKKKIAIIGRRAQRIVDIAIEYGYLSIPKTSLTSLRFIDEKTKNNDKDLVCLVTGNRHEPFYMLQRMCKKADRLIHIDQNDTIIMMTAPVPGTEKMAARTMDILSRSDATVKVIDKKLLSFAHATAEEIKMMINLLRPQYIIPTIGEYRHQYGVRELAKSIGYEDDNVFLLDNGDTFNYTKNKGVFINKQDFKIGEILIDGTAVGDVNDHVMRDRELMADDGVLLVIANISAKEKKILGDIEVVSKGFVSSHGEVNLHDNIKLIFKEVAKNQLSGKYINWNEFKGAIKDSVTSYVYQETRRKPITIPVIVSTEKNSNK